MKGYPFLEVSKLEETLLSMILHINSENHCLQCRLYSCFSNSSSLRQKIIIKACLSVKLGKVARQRNSQTVLKNQPNRLSVSSLTKIQFPAILS